MTKDDKPAGNTLAQALKLAEQGFHIFPVVADGKKPAIKGWQEQATRNTDQITKWFEQASYNIGIATGKFGDGSASLCVLDIDMKNGKNGEASLKSLCENRSLPETMQSRTPSGGRHIIFTTKTPFRNGVDKLGQGIDIRGAGGYIVAPGSTIDGKPYSAIDDVSPAPVPSWLMEELAKKRAKSKTEQTARNAVSTDNPCYIEKARSYLKDAQPAIQGQAGDNHTIVVANQLGDFGVGPEKAYELLLESWNPRCVPQWAADDLLVKVNSAYDSRLSAIGCLTGEYQFSDVSHLISNDNRPVDHGIASKNTAGGRLSANMKLYTIAEMLNSPPSSFLIDGLLPETGVAVLAGQSGDMKTFLAVCLACSVATGMKIGNRTTKQKSVLIMLNEGQSGIGLRVKGWMDYFDHQELGAFRIMKSTPDLMQSGSVEKYIDSIENEGTCPGLVIIDTFSKATVDGDDNNANDMTKAFVNAYRIADKFGALVLLIDHLGKVSKRGVRGSSAKYGAADMVGLVKKIGDYVQLKVDKQKEAEDGFTLTFSRMMQTIENSSSGGELRMPVLLPMQEFGPVLSQNEWVLNKLELDGETPRMDLLSEFKEEYGDGKTRNFKSVISRLKEQGKITEENGLIWKN